AEESIDQLTKLTASLLDAGRLQAGAQAVFPRPADLGEVIADSLDGLGQQGRPVMTDIPSGLPKVMADPAGTQRALGNLLSNALRYSPPASPPLLAARARGDQVELRIVDHGPG